MPAPTSPLAAVFNQIKKLASTPAARDIAVERASSLPSVLDVKRYSPSALARAATLSPAAQRGFSESLVSTRPPFAAMMMRPSEFLERTPSLDTARDAAILKQLTPAIEKQKLRDLPLLWLEEYPQALEAGYEGRHRMKALQELYGDDPVLMSMVKGDRFNIIDSPYYPQPVREYAGEIEASPLELLKRQIMFGDKPVDINPLWMSE